MVLYPLDLLIRVDRYCCIINELDSRRPKSQDCQCDSKVIHFDVLLVTSHFRDQVIDHVGQEDLECDKLYDRINFVYVVFELMKLFYLLFKVFIGSGAPMFDKLDHDSQLLTVGINGFHTL